MTIADLVYEQVKTLPDQLAREVLDFVGYLRERQERREWRNLAEAQTGSLAPVWDNARTKSGTMFERGDLLLVPFPFTDLSSAKRRPVLALTGPDGYNDFIALPVTSRPQREHGLPLAANDLISGRLPAPSWTRTIGSSHSIPAW